MKISKKAIPWKSRPSLVELNKLMVNMANHLAMEFTLFSEHELSGKMPVDHRTRQPFGILHGGASCAFAETLGSVASNLCLDSEKYISLGMSLQANYLRPITKGFVHGYTHPLHLGQSSHLWEITLYSDSGEVTSVFRLLTAIRQREKLPNSY